MGFQATIIDWRCLAGGQQEDTARQSRAHATLESPPHPSPLETKSELARLNIQRSAGKASFRNGCSSGSGFTLIELILVMAILTMAVSVTAPTLAHFFRGRTLDSEARRLLALTRNGQNRAVSEGIPMNLWLDSSAGMVGLDAEPSFETDDARAVEFTIDSGLQLEVLRQAAVSSMATNTSRIQPISTASVAPVKLTHPNLPTIRFLPDGTVGDDSPQTIRLTGRDGVSLLVALAPDRLSYEIRHSDK